MQKITVCKDCPDRYPACHDHCKKYIKAKQELQEHKDMLLKAMRKDAIYMDYKRKKIRKERRI